MTVDYIYVYSFVLYLLWIYYNDKQMFTISPYMFCT